MRTRSDGGPPQIRVLAASDAEAQADTWQSLREALNEGLESIDRRLQEYGPLELLERR